MRMELAWREFYADVLWHRPESARQSLQAFGNHLRWDTDARARERFRAWAMGRTGYPLVDAGMRQLLTEGWMHNRVRMVTASFLVKDLHVDWRLGARWFMWHLVDGDLASNQHGWQWVAGTGTDAAPFYRVLNPILQQRRFDPDGAYVRRYLGEAAPTPVPDPTVSSVGNGYLGPIVDHQDERREALSAFSCSTPRSGHRESHPGLTKPSSGKKVPGWRLLDHQSRASLRPYGPSNLGLCSLNGFARAWAAHGRRATIRPRAAKRGRPRRITNRFATGTFASAERPPLTESPRNQPITPT